jgi:hypothetical protein
MSKREWVSLSCVRCGRQWKVTAYKARRVSGRGCPDCQVGIGEIVRDETSTLLFTALELHASSQIGRTVATVEEMLERVKKGG